ncbi:YpjP family protein [Pseudogracilibacillus sp. SO30301A]|uniref:YpjP family protein n=1 Tax=Pseudogracilibacillus sp. SO30301A TaxID=3098291 RepID=UPI00300E557D
MKLWMRKTFVILIAIMTLGMYVPPVSLNTDAAESKDISSNSSPSENNEYAKVVDLEESESTFESSSFDSDSDIDFASLLITKAQEQTITKLGPKIASQIEDEFTVSILPGIEEVITTIIADAEEDAVPYYAITERPSSGFGERIFHVYDERNKKDVARFHVRRENRPLEGYWFNFHYHLSKDNFEEHYEIGDIYWDKNTPPKWMS